MRRKKGQSILEYVIVLTAIVAAIAIVATKYIKPAVEDGIGKKTEKIIDSAVERLPGAK